MQIYDEKLENYIKQNENWIISRKAFNLEIMDLYAICHPAFWLDIYEENTGFRTSCLNIALNRILKYATNPDTVVVICSDGKKLKRQEIDSNYKANRKSKMKLSDRMSLDTQCRLIEEICANLGLDVYRAESVEADDWVYSIISKLYNNFEKINIHSTDRDYAYLIDEKVSLVSTNRLVKDLNVNNFNTAFKSKITDMCVGKSLIYKMSIGDSSDGIKGLTSSYSFCNDMYNKLIQSGFTDWQLRSPDILEKYFLDQNKHLLEPFVYQIFKHNLKLIRHFLVEEKSDYYGVFGKDSVKKAIEMMSVLKIKGGLDKLGCKLIEDVDNQWLFDLQKEIVLLKEKEKKAI